MVSYFNSWCRISRTFQNVLYRVALWHSDLEHEKNTWGLGNEILAYEFDSGLSYEKSIGENKPTSQEHFACRI